MIFEKLFFLIAGLFMPALVLAQEPGHTAVGITDGHMMSSTGGLFMWVIWILLTVLLVVAIMALIKYLRDK